MDLSYWYFFILALFGAVVASATGAGGGVVFVPAFNMLGLSPQSIIATSFAIQCFGMSAGAFAWFNYAKQPGLATEVPAWQSYSRFILWFSVPAVIGVVAGQTIIDPGSPQDVKALFKVFSMAFAVAILVTTAYIVKFQNRALDPVAISPLIKVLFVVVGLIGGTITAWLSIGVGELIAVLLILMRYPVRMAVGVAASVSAVSVLVGVQKYLWFEPTIDTSVLLFAGPAAAIGGTIAKRVVAWFSPVQLKLFIASWILISAFAM
ncbi:sulfite exporter TauE/SafE family protein [Arenicella xantha]|uniref:Probable membrane transporter protein n=1 Tax=Arenicella xantha TaxID=644221 RepID=A0A395JLG5_9GAMM|nr:sulfite exporter TauE/SafE family protein [Arenicella xantha]RBP51636.1 putative membrane protein YfcA [Arenicella xantha]